MTKTSKVVDLTSRSGYHPDCTALARHQLIEARRELGLTAAEFAEKLAEVVGWPVTAKALVAWERTASPPGDVLIAAGILHPSAEGIRQPIGGVLRSIPPSFPAATLCGWWATCFQFGPDRARKRHVDLAEISLDYEPIVHITNHPPAPRSEGRASPFCNDLEGQLANRHMVGRWKNSNDTRYFGTFQLAVLPGENVMAGHYTGFGSDVEVSAGPWKWVRLGDASLAGADPAVVQLRDPAVLGALIEEHTPYHPALTLADIEQEP